MKLDTILRNPIESLLYMERYVNIGSPSGFSQKHTTSRQFDPVYGNETFPLPYFAFSRTELKVFGDEQPLRSCIPLEEETLLPFFIHPDMIDLFYRKYSLSEFNRLLQRDNIEVSPLANGRTVFPINSDYPFQIKLHYEGILGRINRGLPLQKAVSGPEISSELKVCATDGILPKTFAFFPESLALTKITGNPSLPEIGMVLRDKQPFPLTESRALIPFFSLFSRDSHNNSDDLLLVQILNQFDDPISILMDRIVSPVVECYAYLVFQRGIMPETNAQNILLEIDEACNPIRIVHRDMQGYEKDITIRHRKCLPTDFESAPYKCIDQDADPKLYFMRHSFSYDFKLGHYVLDELTRVASESFNVSRPALVAHISDVFHRFAGTEAFTHFNPVDKWYNHDNVLLTHERVYVEHDKPKYRRTF